MADKARVQLLVDALLSGTYEQGFGVLEKTVAGRVRHCCLGVACRVAMANGVPLNTFEGAGDGVLTYFSGQTGTLPVDVCDWYGFDEVNPRLLDDDDHVSYSTKAIDLNDSRRESFALIAQRFKLRYVDETDEARAATQTEIDRLETEWQDAHAVHAGDPLLDY